MSYSPLAQGGGSIPRQSSPSKPCWNSTLKDPAVYRLTEKQMVRACHARCRLLCDFLSLRGLSPLQAQKQSSLISIHRSSTPTKSKRKVSTKTRAANPDVSARL